MRARDFLDASKRIEDAATEGPWGRHDIGYSGDQEPSSIVIHTGKFDWSAIVNDSDYIAMMSAWDAQGNADAEFIAHARTALPKMRAALEAAYAEKDDLPHYYQPDHMPSSEYEVGYYDGVLAVVRAIESALTEGDEE